MRHSADVRAYDVHALVSVGAVTTDFIDQLQRLAPFGQGNVTPRLALNAVMVSGLRFVGKNQDTLACDLVDEGRNRVGAVAFGAAAQPHGQALIQASRTQTPLHIVGEAKINTYRDRRQANIEVRDVAWPEGSLQKPA